VQKITFIHRKIHKKTVATRAALFGSNMHQIVCRLELCPRPQLGVPPVGVWGRPDPLAVFRGPTSKGEGSGERGEGKKGRGGSYSFGSNA